MNEHNCPYTDAQIIEQAITTRRLQISYFRYRDPISLKEAKQAEKLLDTMLALYEKQHNPAPCEPAPKQNTLF